MRDKLKDVLISLKWTVIVLGLTVGGTYLVNGVILGH